MHNKDPAQRFTPGQERVYRPSSTARSDALLRFRCVIASFAYGPSAPDSTMPGFSSLTLGFALQGYRVVKDSRHALFPLELSLWYFELSVEARGHNVIVTNEGKPGKKRPGGARRRVRNRSHADTTCFDWTSDRGQTRERPDSAGTKLRFLAARTGACSEKDLPCGEGQPQRAKDMVKGTR